MTHTPGPWHATDYNYVLDDGGAPVATIIDHGKTRDTVNNNAHLIAAAPAGLELAYAFKSYLEDDSRSERRRQVCLQACNDFIAKATNGS